MHCEMRALKLSYFMRNGEVDVLFESSVPFIGDL